MWLRRLAGQQVWAAAGLVSTEDCVVDSPRARPIVQCGPQELMARPPVIMPDDSAKPPYTVVDPGLMTAGGVRVSLPCFMSAPVYIRVVWESVFHCRQAARWGSQQMSKSASRRSRVGCRALIWHRAAASSKG